MHKKECFLALFTVVTALLYPEAMAGKKFSFSTGATYISGDYGRSEKTEIYIVPFTFKYKIEKFKFKLTLPYIEKTGPKNVIRDIGQVGQQVLTKRTTEKGLGNISASIRYKFYYNQQYKFLMDLEGKVNIGTASESKGLGTGKTDYSFKLGLYKVFDRLTPYTKFGYKIFGSPQLHDVFFASAGMSYKVNPILSAGFDFAWREKVSDTGVNKRQLTGFSSQKITKNWGLQEYVIKGFGRSTADWGGGLSVKYSY
jgi:hypothetical protein